MAGGGEPSWRAHIPGVGRTAGRNGAKGICEIFLCPIRVTLSRKNVEKIYDS